MAKKTNIIAVELTTRNKEEVLKVVYESGAVRHYASHIPPESVIEFLGGHGEWANKTDRMRKEGLIEVRSSVEQETTTTTPEEPEAAETEKPKQDANEEPKTIATEEPAKVGHITAVEPEQMEEPETATPAAIVPIIQEPVKPAAVTKYKPASEVVMFSLCMVLMYAALAVRYGAELLIIAIQNVWSHREEYAEKVRTFFYAEIKPAAILAGYIATDTATAAASWTVETGKQIIIAVTIITFMVGIYSN